jgi:hypothetical protein
MGTVKSRLNRYRKKLLDGLVERGLMTRDLKLSDN